MSLGFKSVAISDVGLQRDGNEDSALISPLLVAVADGMGGHAAGEVASKVAVDLLAGIAGVLTDGEIDSDSREDLLLNIPEEIDAELLNKAKSNPEYAGMGTTLTALYLNGSDAELLHIGDSRCYFIKKNKVEQLSHDHTVMQELLDQGRLSADEVYNHPQRSLLTQVLMGDSGIHPMLMVREVKKGDRFLLCSDGLSSVLSELEINQIVKKSEDLLMDLLNAVREKGAPDNVTIILSEVVEISEASKLSNWGRLMPRTLANRYELGALIGTGGMADVYVAEDRRLSRKVAIKLLRSDLARDPQFISRFKKEALAAAGLNHPSIVSVFDSGDEAGNSFIVMELVHGKTLRDLMQGEVEISEEKALEIIAGVLEALDYSHQNGVVHRDGLWHRSYYR